MKRPANNTTTVGGTGAMKGSPSLRLSSFRGLPPSKSDGPKLSYAPTMRRQVSQSLGGKHDHKRVHKPGTPRISAAGSSPNLAATPSSPEPSKLFEKKPPHTQPRLVQIATDISSVVRSTTTINARRIGSRRRPEAMDRITAGTVRRPGGRNGERHVGRRAGVRRRGRAARRHRHHGRSDSSS